METARASSIVFVTACITDTLNLFWHSLYKKRGVGERIYKNDKGTAETNADTDTGFLQAPRQKLRGRKSLVLYKRLGLLENKLI